MMSVCRTISLLKVIHDEGRCVMPDCQSGERGKAQVVNSTMSRPRLAVESSSDRRSPSKQEDTNCTEKLALKVDIEFLSFPRPAIRKAY